MLTIAAANSEAILISLVVIFVVVLAFVFALVIFFALILAFLLFVVVLVIMFLSVKTMMSILALLLMCRNLIAILAKVDISPFACLQALWLSHAVTQIYARACSLVHTVLLAHSENILGQ